MGERGMLARKLLPAASVRWNRDWGVPDGTRWYRACRSLGIQRLASRVRPSFGGPFKIQVNNSTRRVEYPWAFFATPITPGLKVLEIGGGLAGFQFVLDRAGCHVTNVDPGMEAHGQGWPVDQHSMARLNSHFGTHITLHNCFLHEAPLAPATFDRAFSISVLEHIPVEEISTTIVRIYDLLKPGGYLVVTLDLFINLAPFCSRTSNEYGSNVPARLIAEAAPFELLFGDRRELLGYPEFDPDRILSMLEQLMLGEYPALAQLMVLKKPVSA